MDLILNSLRATLDLLYSDRSFLKDLYKEGRLFEASFSNDAEDKTAKKIENLKLMADDIYRRFYRSSKYSKLVKEKVAAFKEVRKVVGKDTNRLPVTPLQMVSRYLEPDDRGHYYDKDDIFKPPLQTDQQWSDPNFALDDWAFKPPSFKKGFNSKFTRINMKDVNPSDKKLDDYFNRKQIVDCTARNIITQPLREIMSSQLADLNLEEEKVPRSVYCVFDKDGRLT